MLLPKTIEYDLPADLIEAARRSYLDRYHRNFAISLLPVGAVGILGVLDQSQKGQSGGQYWLFILFSALFILHWLVVRWAARQARPNLSNIPARHVTVRLESDAITIKMQNDIGRLEWPCILKIWKFQDFVLLLWDKKDFDKCLILPNHALDPESLQFIEEKIRGKKRKPQ